MNAKEPEWEEVRRGRRSVMVAGFDSDEELFDYLLRVKGLDRSEEPMAWYLDQLGDA